MPSSIFVDRKDGNYLPPSVSSDNYQFNLLGNSFDVPNYTKLTAKEQIIVKSGDKNVAINTMLLNQYAESFLVTPTEERVTEASNIVSRLVSCISDCKKAQKTPLINLGNEALRIIGIAYYDSYKMKVSPAEPIKDDDSEEVKAKKAEQSRQWLEEFRISRQEYTKEVNRIRATIKSFPKNKTDAIANELRALVEPQELISGSSNVPTYNKPEDSTEALMYAAEALKSSIEGSLETRLDNLISQCSTAFESLYKPYEAYVGLESDLMLFANIDTGNGVLNTVIKKGLNLFLENRELIEDVLNAGLTSDGIGALIGVGVEKLKDEALKYLTIDKLIATATTYLTVMGVPSNVTQGLAKASRRLYQNGMSMDVIADITMSLVTDTGDVLSGDFRAEATTLVDYVKGLMKEGLKPIVLVESFTEKFESILNSGAVNVMCVAMFALTMSTAAFKIVIWLKRLVRNIKSGISSFITKVRTLGEEALNEFSAYVNSKISSFVQMLVGGMLGFVNQYVPALMKLLPINSLISSAITSLLSLFGITIVKDIGINSECTNLAMRDGSATAKALEEFGAMDAIYKKGKDFVTGIDFGSVPEGASIPLYGDFGGPNCGGKDPHYKVPLSYAVEKTITLGDLNLELPKF